MYPEKWRAFGRQLNIDPEMLDIIWKESNRNPEDAFNQVLLIWKSRKTVPYTWCTMCDILETHEVGCSSLSYDIKSKKWTSQQKGNWHFNLGKHCTIKIMNLLTNPEHYMLCFCYTNPTHLHWEEDNSMNVHIELSYFWQSDCKFKTEM